MTAMNESAAMQQSRHDHRRRIDHFLSLHLTRQTPTAQRLQQAIEYTLLAGGKRIRPLLVYTVAESVDVSLQQADFIAGAIEMIHAYSLIHDDLPAMDNDDLRRGNPTCHIQFDEATAILAGDALQAMAFELISQMPAPAEAVVHLVNALARACGVAGMAGGQSLDLEAENAPPDFAHLQSIHQLKTGALLSACVDMTAQLNASLSKDTLAGLHRFGRHFGIAFQIVDDILDVTSDTDTLGKPAGSDSQNNKMTYPDLLGIDGARQAATSHIAQARQALSDMPLNAQGLWSLTELILNRSS